MKQFGTAVESRALSLADSGLRESSMSHRYAIVWALDSGDLRTTS